jgi:hypothetical protein
MNQIINAMKDEGVGFMFDMSREEKRAFQELFNACEDFMNLSEELQDEYDREHDGQPDEAQEWHDFDPEC